MDRGQGPRIEAEVSLLGRPAPWGHLGSPGATTPPPVGVPGPALNFRIRGSRVLCGEGWECGRKKAPRAVPQEGTQTLPRIQPPAFPEGEEPRVLQGTSLSPRRERALPSLVYDQHTRCKPSSNWCFYFHQAVFTFLRAVTVHPSLPAPPAVQPGPSPSRALRPGVDAPLGPVPQSLPLRGLAGNTPVKGKKVLVSEQLRDIPEDSIADPQRGTMGGTGGPWVGNRSFCCLYLWGRLIN